MLRHMVPKTHYAMDASSDDNVTPVRHFPRALRAEQRWNAFDQRRRKRSKAFAFVVTRLIIVTFLVEDSVKRNGCLTSLTISDDIPAGHGQ